jgi:hypothetical protein
MRVTGARTSGLNSALTVVAPARVNVHADVPAHPPPLQPAKRMSWPGLGPSLTFVPRSNRATHRVPQSIPPGALTTVPEPEPVLVMVSATSRLNLATICVPVVTFTTQGTFWAQPPPAQLTKRDPGPAAAVSDTFVPWS